MDPAEELLKNGAILENIFQYLSLEDQIQCVDICESFRFVLKKVVWKNKYRDMNIYKTPYISVFTNKWEEHSEGRLESSARELQRNQEPKLALKYGKCNIFLKHMANSVNRLRVYSEYFIFRQSMGVGFRRIQLFRNLRHLGYHQMVVTDEHLQLVAKHCLKLRKLELIECHCCEWYSLIPGFNLDLGNLTKMPQLRELVLQANVSSSLPEMDSDVLYEMLNQLKLKTLILKNIRIKDSGSDTVAIARSGGSLEVLNVGRIPLEFWPRFKHCLKELHYLTELVINVMDCNTLVNTADVEVMAINCHNLLKLSLENCDLYIEEFGLLKTLQHLELVSCGGFTAGNLQQVLGNLQLRSLALVNTLVLGNISAIYVAPSLETIKVDTIYFSVISEAFQKSLSNMGKLHTIKWLNGQINDPWITDKCPNLKILHIPNIYLMRHSILKMTTLQELSFTSCTHLSWAFLLIVIKNLKLKRLSLEKTDTINDAREIPQNAYDVRTSLESIVIPFAIYKTAQNFWMDLLHLNSQLKMVFYGEHEDLFDTHFLRGLLRFPHLRDNLKSIKMCGFSIDVCDLQNNFGSTVHGLNAKTSHYRSRNTKFTIEI